MCFAQDVSPLQQGDFTPKASQELCKVSCRGRRRKYLVSFTFVLLILQVETTQDVSPMLLCLC